MPLVILGPFTFGSQVALKCLSLLTYVIHYYLTTFPSLAKDRRGELLLGVGVAFKISNVASYFFILENDGTSNNMISSYLSLAATSTPPSSSAAALLDQPTARGSPSAPLLPKSADDEEVHDGLIFYVPFNDSYDDGFKRDVDDHNNYQNRTKTVGSKTLFDVLRSLEERSQPVTCLVYNMLLAWVGDLAREYGIRSAVYWIEPATVFAVYYHYFQG
ncbi:crocetin glucosyltransferase, chloroplastic-like [Canna indica]|uniref:Crocetin glucosyltransferase, chloroplastic-like n=1 Tax=Canna indica TaxID=4628 RepID=A0AAQ3KT63_9LILI|nr:crocetin glucosyltransferase, chloroplastic-like [Canna indica]